MLFFVIVIGLPFLDLYWWRWADARLTPMHRHKLWRGLLALMMISMLVLYAIVIASRISSWRAEVPVALLSAVYLWHIVVLPTAVTFALAAEVISRNVALVRSLRQKKAERKANAAPGASPASTNAANLGAPATVAAPAPNPTAVPTATPGPTRRQVLAAATVVLPPLLLTGLTVRGVSQLNDFRVRRLRIPLRDLPPALDGMTIAHVSDIHVGRYSTQKLLDAVVEQTNALRADLVLVTGDTIDYALSDLPAGLDMFRKTDPRHGLFMCEGNHDLFQDRDEFEQRVKASGVPLLLNESQLVRIRGEFVQVMGLKWGHLGRQGNLASDELSELLARREAGAFPILLAHHPHAFDAAAAAGVPLTLSGHTHGGQLMLGHDIGVGPMMFKYWSGLYRKQDAALVVSNGVGNWFPLRINAPAEIVHITLTRG